MGLAFINNMLIKALGRNAGRVDVYPVNGAQSFVSDSSFSAGDRISVKSDEQFGAASATVRVHSFM